jgi:hypothetical protein
MYQKEFRSSIEVPLVPMKEPILLNYSDVLGICSSLWYSKKSLPKMFGLFLFILLNTAARNKTIRELKFS